MFYKSAYRPPTVLLWMENVMYDKSDILCVCVCVSAEMSCIAACPSAGKPSS